MKQKPLAYLKSLNANYSQKLHRCRWSPEDAQEIVPRLITFLDDPDPFVQQETLRALCHIGTPALAAGARVVELTRSSEQMTRIVAVQALGQIAQTDPKMCIGPSIAALPDAECRVHALRILEFLGPAAAEALDHVLPYFDNPLAKERAHVLRVAAEIAPTDPKVIALIQQAQTDRSQEVRKRAAKLA
ncbi:hypothetical protein AB1L30_05180 [Bremerella sp. JC817]|uniref:HEAT repeat domain-containing protein n=1 Tax=Bremerella sp. JC817 TaxID=3231756 RepID=UPI0034596C7D